ncbi:MAG: type IX secretion system membrane protein PorP/SprF [Bacteroidetes bacterium]|nr:type IX secretion system membrane protein PorP/SprF [Bacteroidota bacterium]
MKKLLWIIAGLFAASPSFAQQDPMYSQYLYNMLTVNPAYAGSHEQLSTVLFYRNQWTGFKGAPVTTNISVHSPFKNTNGAWGINAFNDRIGVQKQDYLNLNYAYRIISSKGTLSLGMSAGVYQFSNNYNELQMGQGDPLFSGNETYKLFNFGFGAYYKTSKMALGISVPHFLNRAMVNRMAYKAVNPADHLYLTGSYLIFLSDDYVFKPSAMIRYVNNAPMQMDLNATIIYKNSLYMGISYRTINEASLMVQYQLNKNWWFGYAYDVPFGVVKSISRGSHEIFLGFDISFDKTKMLSPRYF